MVNELPPTCAALDAECRQPEVCPLNEVRVGASVRIKHLNTAPDVKVRLREMGFCEEQRIKLLLKHTNVICQVCNVRLGISKQLAESIMVERPLATRQKAA